MKTDPQGNEEWSRTFVGENHDMARSLVQTSDGGYALAGWTHSFGAGFWDFWLVKTDPQGNEEWSRTFGGEWGDEARSLIQTSDGGFALAGWTNSFGSGEKDFWLVKTDSRGNKEWSRTFGGENSDGADSLVQTSDNGFALGGWTRSFGPSEIDSWLVKTDSQGNEEWSRTFGGENSDWVSSLIQAPDGGYALAGMTESFGAGRGDFWLVKTDPQGNEEWSRTYGGENWDEANSLVQASDGGFALAGETNSFGPSCDVWLVKTDSRGNKEWSRTFGGENYDQASSLVQTSDGGYALAGWTDSFGAGEDDVWLVKAGPASASPGGLTPHDPIHIEGDNDFTHANGVVGGSGTADDPYVIENWAIDASSAPGIWIENTTKHFVVRNCAIENGRGYDHPGIYLDNVINGKIDNNTCENNRFGIVLRSSSGNTLSGNTCENNGSGIWLSLWSDNNILSGNTCESNGLGIGLTSSENNTLSCNTCENNDRGIWLDTSSNNTLDNNLMESNTYNFGVMRGYDQDIDTSNLVDGRPIYYLVENSDAVIGPSLNPGYVGLVECDNVRVENLVLERNVQGILLASTENSRVENNTFENNSAGIYLDVSSGNTLSGNTCENNDWLGILLWDSSGNTLSGNTCENNEHGIGLTSSDNNTLSGNTCENNEHGIGLTSSDNNTLSGNTCENNEYGIGLKGSRSNTLSGNTCENNSRGIWLWHSYSNNIFHNYLLNNAENNAYDDATNSWDENGEGNYWCDWQPPDHPDADGDGIVDEPRPITSGTNQDRYPLVLPSNEPPTADAGGPYEVDEGGTVLLDGTGSSDSDGTIESYGWEITSGPGSLEDAGSSEPTYVTPEDVDSDTDVTVKLTVTDDGGATSSVPATITVNDVPEEGFPWTVVAMVIVVLIIGMVLGWFWRTGRLASMTSSGQGGL